MDFLSLLSFDNYVSVKLCLNLNLFPINTQLLKKYTNLIVCSFIYR